MASTSTNKQPLLIDRVLNNVISLDGAVIGSTTGYAVGGTNSAKLLVDCINNNRDGALIEDLFTISMAASGTTKVLFYLSTAADYLRSTEGVFVGDITPNATAGAYQAVAALPKVLAPVPQVGNDPKNQALYIPGGKALWVALQTTVANAPAAGSAPVVGAQGGFF